MRFGYLFDLHRIIIFFIALFFITNIKAQTIEEWLKSNTEITERNYCFGRAQQTKIDSKKISDSKMGEIESDLYTKCIQNISTEINVDKQFLKATKRYVYFEKKENILYAIVVIDKIELSKRLLVILENNLKTTDSRLATFQGNAFKDAETAQSKVEEVSREVQKNIVLKNSILALNENLNFQDCDDLLRSIYAEINKLQRTYQLQAKREDINVAKSLLVNNRFLDAYKKFLNLNVQYPNVDEIIEGMEESRSKLLLMYDTRIEEFIHQKRLDLAVKSIDTLIAVDINFNQKYGVKKRSINEDLFNQITEKIETQLRYEQPSPKNLNDLLIELEKISYINQKLFQQYQIKVEKVTVDFQIKNAKSLLYNQNYNEALRSVTLLKKQTSIYDKRIDKLEQKLEDKIGAQFKKTLLDSRCARFALEPSLMLMIPETNIENYAKIQHYNLNFMYGGGIYYRFNAQPKYGNSRQFHFSQIGVKMDYLDTRQRYFRNDSLGSFNLQQSYFNPQLSLNIRKILQIDLGYLTNSSNFLNTDNMRFTGALSFYIPINFISLGVTSRYISDFKGINNFSVGYGIKMNLGFSKKFTADDKMEIQTRIMKIKNQ
jgi:hypothetical protein